MASQGAKTGSQAGYNYWAFDARLLRDLYYAGRHAVKFYCFENP